MQETDCNLARNGMIYVYCACMILAIDIGNTNIVIGCIDENMTCFVERLSTDRTKTELEYAIAIKTVLDIYHIKYTEITGGILSSVVPQITHVVQTAAETILQQRILIVGPGLDTGISIKTDNPQQVGSDLITGVAAAAAEYPAPAVVIDMGTATTICIMDEKKNFTGCIIMPGVQTALESLTAKAAQLQGIAIEAPPCVLGTNTIESMQSGIVYGNAAALDGLIDRIEEEIGTQPTLIATGGLAKEIIPHCRRKIILDSDLLLKGLWHIYKRNRPVPV